jgi:hypothetical protein
MRIIFITLLHLCFIAKSHAETNPANLLAPVIEGRTSFTQAEMTGDWANMIKGITHSQDNPFMRVEMEKKWGKCSSVLITTTQANIPTVDGKNAGEYRSVTRFNSCNDGKLPAGVQPQELVSCTIGGKVCPKPSPRQ